MQKRLAAGAVVYPSQPFKALELTPRASVKVVILGQDPYHGPGQAHGLAFSVPPGVAVPPSLRNVYKEIARVYAEEALVRLSLPTHPASIETQASAEFVLTAQNSAGPPRVDGSLNRWAKQGVLLLNTCLTVEQGAPASHVRQGWEALTDEIIKAVWTQQQAVVLLLWGAHAQAKQALLTADQAGGASGLASRLVLLANHPSPLSALRGPSPFIGCGHFLKANRFLMAHGIDPIIW